jgi:hypothetical protein
MAWFASQVSKDLRNPAPGSLGWRAATAYLDNNLN